MKNKSRSESKKEKTPVIVDADNNRVKPATQLI